MPSCIMLDVDGVLINGRPRDGASWATSLREDLGVDPTGLQQHFFKPFWKQVVTGQLDIRDVLDQCLPRLGDGITTEQFMQYWFKNDARLDESVLADCVALRDRGLKIVLATNQEHQRANYIMSTLKLADYVDGIVYSADIGVAKPDPAFFTAAMTKTQQPAHEHILIDDTLENVKAAIAARWSGRVRDSRKNLSDILDDVRA